ncbi:MAG TPA: SDR family oxidoreductase [Steroidobacteraceae bacterium]|nr:SDR family oxidoreductase [Steroidobacteraceae bacterium]
MIHRDSSKEQAVSKVIVITGAGKGLGRALARRFAADGERVVLLARSQARIEQVAADIGAAAMAVACDVRSPDSVRTAFATIAARHPRIDVLINNAAIYEPFMIEEARDDQILASLMTNLAGPVYCTRAAIPVLPRGGHIINVSSESVAEPFFMHSLYRSSKAGLEKFSEAMSRELAPRGIRVTLIRAGAMMDEDSTLNLDPQVRKRFVEGNIAAGIDFRVRPISHFKSVTSAFRALIDLPPDVQADFLSLHARAADR